MPKKDKQGFPIVPEKDKFADDLGYITKIPKKKPIKNLLGKT